MSEETLARLLGGIPHYHESIYLPYLEEYPDRELLVDTDPGYTIIKVASPQLTTPKFLDDIVGSFYGDSGVETWPRDEEAARRTLLAGRLDSAPALEDVATLLETEHHGASAARVRRLLEIAVEEEDDGEEEPQIESLRSLARFLLLESRGLPRPTLVLGSSGLFTAEWDVLPSGGMSLHFVSDDELQFTGVANIRDSDPPYQETDNVYPREKALGALSVFTKDPQIDLAGADSPSRPRSAALPEETS